MSIRDSLLDCIDDVLGVRECIGAQLADVYLVTRIWTGERVGDGQYTDELTKVSPTPEIVDFSHDVRLTEVGAVKQGDLILRGISRNKFKESDLRTDTGKENVIKYYKVGNHYYSLIHIKENLVTWDIHLRKTREDQNERG